MSINASDSNWGSWAKFIVNETQRFSKEIESLHIDLKQINKEYSDIKTDVVRLNFSASSNNSNDLLKTELKSEINTITNNISNMHNDFRNTTERLAREISEAKSDIDANKAELIEYGKFKVQILTGVALINLAAGAVVIIYVG